MGRHRNLVLVGLAVFLAAVPTFWTVFTYELGDLTLWLRIPVIVVWLIAAVVAGRIATRRDANIDALVLERSEEVAKRVTRVMEEVLGRLLGPGVWGMPQEYEITVYVMDSGSVSLKPIWPSTGAERSVTTFGPGKGATGRAWTERELKLVRGDDVSNSLYELTEEQQAFYADGRAVVATPMNAPDGTALGVLTAFSRIDDDYFERSASRERFRDLAAVVGALLDASGWAGA